MYEGTFSEKSKSINDIPNSFSARPLDGKDLHVFYEDTITVRTADQYTSPIEDIYDACVYPSEDHIFILMGHTGCGKSTELNKMADEMRAQGFKVRTMNCLADIGQTPHYTDLLILMGEALISISQEIGCSLDSDLGRAVLEFWNTEVTQITDSSAEYAIDLNAGAEVDSSSVFLKIFKLFAGIKSGIKLKQLDSTEYKRKIEQRSEGWYASIAKIADLITDQLDGKQPVIIFEDLDKLDRVNPQVVWDMFSVHAANLSNFSFPVIYTFPISLSYDPRFGTLTGYFLNKTLPMIELQYVDDTPCTEGFCKIRDIVYSRADSDLFEEEALRHMIEKTGGSLRDLFTAIRDASTRARRRHASKINIEDAAIAQDFFGFFFGIHFFFGEILEEVAERQMDARLVHVYIAHTFVGIVKHDHKSFIHYFDAQHSLRRTQFFFENLHFEMRMLCLFQNQLFSLFLR